MYAFHVMCEAASRSTRPRAQAKVSSPEGVGRPSSRITRIAAIPHPCSNELVHRALLYRSADEYLSACREFIDAGLERDEPVCVAIPWPRHAMLQAAMDGGLRRIELLDMNELGRNPSRIIPAVQDFSQRRKGRRCQVISESIWPGRSHPETVEATRHDALLNVAFRGVAISILCLYDASALDPRVIADAERTHPEMVRGGDRAASAGYADPMSIWHSTEWPLPEPHVEVEKVSIGEDLAALRRAVEGYSRSVGLGAARSSDLVLAVNEVATNTVRYSDTPGELRIWLEQGRVVCEISDGGRLDDPLAGRRHPHPDSLSGRGLWLANQVCDLVEVRPGESGTTVRLHVDIAR